LVSFSDIEAAYNVVSRAAHKTPLLTSRTFNEISGNEVFFKAEGFQRVGAFKFRGAYNKISSLTPEQRKAGVIAHSSGNHAQGVALACKLFGVRAVIVMPRDSVVRKVEATRGYGAEVVFCGNTTDDRERTTDELIAKHGYTLVHPFNDPVLIAGQGTVAFELSRDVKELDYLVVPVGGGGLISGCSIAAKALYPRIKVIGVETEGANDAWQSFRAKKIVKLEKVNTIADGMRTLSIGSLNLEIILQHVDDIITVRDDDLYPMMKFFAERMKIIVEPTGAVAGAAVMKRALGASGRKVCAVISGGNADPEVLKQALLG
jgi:threonine dehydratase